MSIPYPAQIHLYINGQWQSAADGRRLPVLNPATEAVIGELAHAGQPELEHAVQAAQQGFKVWKATPALHRASLLRRAAVLLRERAEQIAPILTQEQGKPLAEARGELLAGADVIDWFAEEARRTYSRLIPARAAGIQQLALKEPVGPVAAFTPWNFPINQIVRKLSAALAAGCSIVIKGPEDTPAAPAALIQVFADAGIPAGVIGLLFGNPAEISSYLIAHPAIRKVSFTGSTAVGKQLAALAGQHMKPVTMELGGHAPVILAEDADLSAALTQMAAVKFRNAGQVCIAPTRFLVQRSRFEEAISRFVDIAAALKIGNGLDEGVQLGPLAHARRLQALEQLLDDARRRGAELHLGGGRLPRQGYFFAPTVLSHLPSSARLMQEEPFGPIALFQPFDEDEEAIAEANRLPYGLAAYAYSRSSNRVRAYVEGIESGMLSVNHFGLALPELPFGGIKDSGFGSEGGPEAIEEYLHTRLVSRADI